MTGVFALKGQQVPIYSGYLFNPLMINPALTGTNSDFNANLIHRNQWAGIESAPLTNTLTADLPLIDRHIGLGLIITSDRIGIFNNTEISTTYAYHINFKSSTLSFGIQAGLSYMDANYSTIKYSRDNDITDNAFSNNYNSTKAIFGSGVFYQTNHYYVGVSLPYLTFGDSHLMGYEKTKIAFLSSGYVFELSNNIFIKPSILIRYCAGMPINVDFNTNFWINKNIGIGISYRPNESIIGIVDLKLNKHFRMSYTHDFSTSALSKFNNGSNEIMIKYQLNKEKYKYLSMQY